jgi:hypothetical protein
MYLGKGHNYLYIMERFFMLYAEKENDIYDGR